MSKDKDKKVSISNAKPIKVHKDFQEFGRITCEDLNDFFDNDVMSSLTATAKRRAIQR